MIFRILWQKRIDVRRDEITVGIRMTRAMVVVGG